MDAYQKTVRGGSIGERWPIADVIDRRSRILVGARPEGGGARKRL
jgi:hypothetical protein